MFTDKVVLVTGAAQGIGRAYAHGFAANGATVVVADFNEEKAGSVVQEIVDGGGNARVAVVDVSSEDAVGRMVSEVVDALGRIDVLVNNAAMFASLTMKPFLEIPVDEWDQVFAVNTRGTFLMTKAVAPVMIEQGGGSIVNISSGVAMNGRPNYLHYLSSKSAINGMTKGMATELGAHGINVNTVSPYGIATEVPRETITPAQWESIIGTQAIHVQGTADTMVGAVLFLSSDAAKFITGQDLHVNGGTYFH